MSKDLEWNEPVYLSKYKERQNISLFSIFRLVLIVLFFSIVLLIYWQKRGSILSLEFHIIYSPAFAIIAGVVIAKILIFFETNTPTKIGLHDKQISRESGRGYINIWRYTDIVGCRMFKGKMKHQEYTAIELTLDQNRSEIIYISGEINTASIIGFLRSKKIECDIQF